MALSFLKTRERKRCACGVVRTVVVMQFMQNGVPDGDPAYNERCNACEYDYKARRLERQAAAYRRRAIEIRLRRKKGKTP